MKTRYIILASLLTLALATCKAPTPTPPESGDEISTRTPVRPSTDESPLPAPGVSPLLSPLPTSRPDAAFQSLRAYLVQMYPGFGLNQQQEWTAQDVTQVEVMGISTWAWRSGEWTLEITRPVVPEPAYESVLFHQRAGAVWRGDLESDGQVTSLYTPPSLSFSVGTCDQSITPDTMPEWAKVDVTVQDGAIYVKQNLSYVCCAEMELAVGQDGNTIRIIETNAGEVCRCMCGYPVTIILSDLPLGTYTVEVWGVQHSDIHPLELLGSAEITIQ
jgi:hypothetical protein